MAGTCSSASGTGPQYNYAELQGLWINAGGSKATAPIAAAIALAESQGCSVAVNPDDSDGKGGTQTSWGLWQWSDGTHNEPPGILAPATNAQAAVTKWKNAGQQFTDWGTYTSGAYRGFLGKGTPDLNVPGSGGAVTTAQDSQADCAWGKIPGVFGGIWPGACIITYKQAREVLGAAILVGGALVAGWGVQLLIGAAALPLATRALAPVVRQVTGARRTVRQVQSIGQ